MTETISSTWRKARKDHECSFCNHRIHKGERYRFDVLKYDGEMFTWKAHEKCNYIAIEIWDYVDPDEGMSEEDFQQAVCDISRDFICPDCEKFDRDDPWAEDCECNEEDKVYELLQKYELYRAWRDHDFVGWKLRERKKKDE